MAIVPGEYDKYIIAKLNLWKELNDLIKIGYSGQGIVFRNLIKFFEKDKRKIVKKINKIIVLLQIFKITKTIRSLKEPIRNKTWKQKR